MNLQYSAIQSITVDSGQKNLNRKSRSIDFLFRLKHPPSLYEVQPTTMADQKRIINLQKTIRTVSSKISKRETAFHHTFWQKLAFFQYNTWSRVLQWPGHDRSHVWHFFDLRLCRNSIQTWLTEPISIQNKTWDQPFFVSYIMWCVWIILAMW